MPTHLTLAQQYINLGNNQHLRQQGEFDSLPTGVQGRSPTWIRNVARGDKVVITTSEDCNAITSCTEAPTPICPYIKVCPNGETATQQVRTVLDHTSV